MPLHPSAKRLRDHTVEGNETTNEEYKTHNGDFATYFRNKQVKLDTQARVQHAQSSAIFDGCIIYITGYTTPSFTVLKRLIVANGGQICAFLGGKSYATHVVAASLTSRKTELYANLKVVKPAWITESVKLGRRLDWTKYRTVTPVGNHTLDNAHDSISSRGDEYSQASSDDESTDNHTDNGMLDAEGPEGDSARTQWILTNRQRVNCMAPNFISEYFAKSRLHFLSMKKLELRKRCRSFMANSTNVHIQQAPLRRTLLHIDFDSFFVAVALRNHPQLKDKPVCVSNGSKGSDIASCNYVARQHGVKNGMWVGRAKGMCPDLICLPYDFADYTKCSDVLYETLLKLEPLHITAISVDEAMVDVSNLVSDGPPVTDICNNIRNEVRKLTGIEVSIGVGSNILLAKIALRQAKPAGVRVIADPTDIAEVSVRDLPGVGHHIYSQLHEAFEVETLAQLQAIQLAELQSTVGNALGQKLYGYSRGMDTNDILSLDVPIKTIGVEIAWGVRLISEVEKMQFVSRLTEELWDRLAKAGATMESLTIKVYAKSKSATFVPPKYMGCGLSDITSRSKRVLPRSSLEEFKQTVKSLVQSVLCPPLLFRGLGLHLKVNDRLTRPLNDRESSEQSRITDVHRTPRSAKTAMLPVAPRKRQKTYSTITQMVPAPHHATQNADLVNEALKGEIDMDVLAELPSQVRKEVFLNEDDYNIPMPKIHERDAPIYKISKFLDLYAASDIRRVIKEWIQSSEMPNAEDAQAFFEFIRSAAEDDSSWVKILDINDWLQVMVQTYAANEDWFVLGRLVDDEVQKTIRRRIEI